jgi:AmiR/NasT family two-component response regulator
VYPGAPTMTATPATGTHTERGLRVLLADEDREKLERLATVLESLGHVVTPFAVSVSEAAEIIAREDPELAIVTVHQDDEHALELIGETVEYAAGPVIAQVPDGDTDFVARAAERGISAWVESTEPNAVQAAIEVAMRRYREARQLYDKVEQLQTALDRRTMIERAKGILMERHGVEERKAFELLRENARSQSRPVVEIAQAVVAGRGLLPRAERRD